MAATLSRHTYYHATRTATYGVLSTLPLLLAYEVLILAVNADAATPVRVGADVWIKEGLALLGASGSLVLAAVVAVVGGAIVAYEWDRNIPLRARYFVGLVLESAVYAVVVAAVVARLVAAVLAVAPAGAAEMGDWWTQVALSIGAGFYEELVFRVVLVGGLYALFRLVMSTGSAYVGAALLGALLFSAVHYIGPLGDAWALGSFLFRFGFGLALNALFLWRGFGVAAWTHALYDLMLVTSVL
jgi:membrane protease YdiL (CAAX protease family)